MIMNLSLESTVERGILKYLNSLPNTKAVKWSQEGRQKGNPDIICCHFGMTMFIEVKREGKTQTPLQMATMDEWVKAGAICMVATRVEQVKAMMEKILGERIKMVEEGSI